MTCQHVVSRSAARASLLLALSITTGLTGEQALAATKPSFDCARAESVAEKAICADPRLAELDRHVARNYKAALKHMDPVARVAMQNDQQNFIRHRNEKAESGDVVTDKDRFAVISELLRKRAEFLGSIAPAPVGTLVGMWRGPGYVKITPGDGGKLHVELETFNPVTSNGVCSLDKIVPNGKSLHIADTDADKNPTERIIGLHRDGDVLIVDQSEPGGWAPPSFNCGIGGGFVGTFFFTGSQ